MSNESMLNCEIQRSSSNLQCLGRQENRQGGNEGPEYSEGIIAGVRSESGGETTGVAVELEEETTGAEVATGGERGVFRKSFYEHFIKRLATFHRKGIDVQLITATSGREHLFFVNLSIGEPPVTQYLAKDTGSHLTWVIGDAFKREFKYPPGRSSTQRNITCRSDACKKLGYCNSIGNCMCQTRYGDGQHKLESYLTYDRFVFQNASVDKMIMGIFCNGKGSLLGEENFYGILDLVPPYPSFVHWLHDLGAKKFSYYINGVVTDSFHPYERPTLGDKADIRGKTTPLRIDGAHYRISLESISLGRKKLDIDPKLFAQKGIEGGTGVIIDSGGIKTWLTDDAYDVVSLDVGDELSRISAAMELWNK
ncbi:Peptidase A1 domain-containing protein [Heracleum sosnowskyi]|uniref:Peptidase A1 domain-containing protein n=1 Tax=Heracleum sosnowskyi TaxID=360622 RepID=A0AAD8GSP6_9APIA|nr:Peptidase A1 domain-containing protein [Heracleum sosnowskyi]